jgi:hypothetical protein
MFIWRADPSGVGAVGVATAHRGSYFTRGWNRYEKAPVVQRCKLLGRIRHPFTTGVHRFESWGFLAVPFTAGGGKVFLLPNSNFATPKN